jgi:hypothetical protein
MAGIWSEKLENSMFYFSYEDSKYILIYKPHSRTIHLSTFNPEFLTFGLTMDFFSYNSWMTPTLGAIATLGGWQWAHNTNSNSFFLLQLGSLPAQFLPKFRVTFTRR